MFSLSWARNFTQLPTRKDPLIFPIAYDKYK